MLKSSDTRASRLLFYACALGIVACTSTPTHAVTFTEQIERLQLVYSALLDLCPGGPPTVYDAGTFSMGLELVPVPSIDNRVGAKDEPVNPPPAYGRARGSVGLGAGFAVGAAYSPPVQLRGYTADLYGLEAEYNLQRSPFVAGLRAFTLFGSIHGPITDPGTRDTFQLQNVGLDGRAGWKFGSWTLYGGLGQGQTQTRLDVASDGSFSKVTATYGYGMVGVGWEHGPWRFAAEQEQTEAYLSHLVFTVRYGF